MHSVFPLFEAKIATREQLSGKFQIRCNPQVERSRPRESQNAEQIGMGKNNLASCVN
jgi:hypothetical protein